MSNNSDANDDITTNRFFEQPILNSPYEYPNKHWELKDGSPTQKIINSRRKADFITPIPKPKKYANKKQQYPLTKMQWNAPFRGFCS